MGKPKFDSSICENCKYFYTGHDNYPNCHFPGKHIYHGECNEYIEKDYAPSEAELQMQAQEMYDREWN